MGTCFGTTKEICTTCTIGHRPPWSRATGKTQWSQEHSTICFATSKTSQELATVVDDERGQKPLDPLHHDEDVDDLVEELCNERRGRKRFSGLSSSSSFSSFSSSPESHEPRHLEPKEWRGRNRGPRTTAPPPPSSPASSASSPPLPPSSSSVQHGLGTGPCGRPLLRLERPPASVLRGEVPGQPRNRRDCSFLRRGYLLKRRRPLPSCTGGLLSPWGVVRKSALTSRRRVVSGHRQCHCDSVLLVFPRSRQTSLPPPLGSGGSIAFKWHRLLEFS